MDVNNYLVAGRHRIEAFKKLKRTMIPSVTTEKGLKAEVSEIDENLIRHELTLLERAEQLQKRKEIYEIMFPETKKGGAWRSVKKTKRNNFVSFSKDTAKITGNSVRTIEHEIQIVNNLPLDVRKTIKNTDLPVSLIPPA